MCSCGRVPLLLTNRHKRTNNSSENCNSVPLFTGLLNIEVCLSVCLFASLLACAAYTEPIQTRSGLIDARYLCLKSRPARVESGAEIAELGHSDCFLPVAFITGILYSNLRVLSQAASNITTPTNALPAPPSPPPPHHRYGSPYLQDGPATNSCRTFWHTFVPGTCTDPTQPQP